MSSTCDLIFKGSVGKIDYVYTILASTVAGCGFLLNSETVIIGSMLLSPFMKPILLMFHNISNKKFEIFFKNFGHLVVFGMIAVIIGSGFGKVVEGGYFEGVDSKELLNSPTISGRTLLKTKKGRLKIGLLSIIAIACGISLALSTYYDRGVLSGVIVGAGISTSILPPLVGGGITFGLGDDQGAYSGIMLSGINLFLIFVSFGITESFLCK